MMAPNIEKANMSAVSLLAVRYSQSTSLRTLKPPKGPNSNTSEYTGTIVKVIVEATETRW